MFGVEVSVVERRLFTLPLRLDDLGICNPVAMASHLFNSSVGGTKHLVRSTVGLKSFELDSHFDCVSSNKQFYHQQLGVAFSEEFGQLLVYLILCSNVPFCEPRMVTFPHGCLFSFG